MEGLVSNLHYTPEDWRWLVVPDGRTWSSAAASWVAPEPGAAVTPIQSVEDLDQVLRAAGLKSPLVTGEDIDAERDRRVADGFTFAGKAFQTRPEDRENIAGASTAALAAIVNGAQAGDLRWHGGDSDFAWIAADNTLVPMDAQTMFAFGQAAMAHKQAMIFAARALKDMAEIPADIADDQWWP